MGMRKRGGFPFLLPGLAWVTIFAILPLIYLVYLSFTNFNLLRPSQFIGLENYIHVFQDQRVWQAFGRTLTFAVGSTILTLIVGTLVAWVFSYDLPGIRLLRNLFTLPLFAAPVAIAVAARIFLSPTMGLINERSLLGDPSIVLITLMIVDAWQWMPLVFITVINAIRNISRSEYEAARLETKSQLAIFTFITYPRVRTALFLIMILRFIESWRVLDLVMTTTAGGPGAATETIMFNLYRTAFQAFNFGYAAALAVVAMIPVILLGVVFVLRLPKRTVPRKVDKLLSWMENLRNYGAAKN